MGYFMSSIIEAEFSTALEAKNRGMLYLSYSLTLKCA